MIAWNYVNWTVWVSRCMIDTTNEQVHGLVERIQMFSTVHAIVAYRQVVVPTESSSKISLRAIKEC